MAARDEQAARDSKRIVEREKNSRAFRALDGAAYTKAGVLSRRKRKRNRFLNKLTSTPGARRRSVYQSRHVLTEKKRRNSSLAILQGAVVSAGRDHKTRSITPHTHPIFSRSVFFPSRSACWQKTRMESTDSRTKSHYFSRWPGLSSNMVAAFFYAQGGPHLEKSSPPGTGSGASSSSRRSEQPETSGSRPTFLDGLRQILSTRCVVQKERESGRGVYS